MIAVHDVPARIPDLDVYSDHGGEWDRAVCSGGGGSSVQLDPPPALGEQDLAIAYEQQVDVHDRSLGLSQAGGGYRVGADGVG